MNLLSGRPPAERPGSAVTWGMALFAGFGIGLSMLGPLIPTFQAEFGIGASTAGLLVSGFFVGALSGTLLFGLLAGALIRPTTMRALRLMVAAGLLGICHLPGWWARVLGSVCFGFGFGGLALLVNTHMAGHPGARGVRLANLANGFFGIGAAIGPAILSLTLDAGYAYPLDVLAVAFVLLWPVSRIANATNSAGSEPGVADDAPAASGTVQKQRRDNVWRYAGFCWLLFCYEGLETGLSAWGATHLRASGYSAMAATALGSAFWFGLAGSRLAIPLVAGRWPAHRIVTGAIAGSPVALLLLAVPATAPGGYLLAGLLAGPILPSALAWIAHVVPTPRTANALAIASSMIGSIVLPPLLGSAMDVLSPGTLPALIAICMILCLVGAVAIQVSTGRRRLAAPDSTTRATTRGSAARR